MRLIKPALVYFILIFAIGFALAMIRIPFLVPRLGERWAELVELPFMVLASFLVARWLVRRFGLVTVMQCIGTGLPALLMMLSAELAVTLFQGQDPGIRGQVLHRAFDRNIQDLTPMLYDPNVVAGTPNATDQTRSHLLHLDLCHRLRPGHDPHSLAGAATWGALG
ncbi:hypothetical protein [Alcanivorax sp.]|uniref:hypothetical protein n=1 Tax=Alcanivorax sp. TaxID=1872427 RepID=UPI0025BBD87A|nr:hypothetical protein [Alcanivorax sp.]